MKVFILAREPFPNGMAATNRIINYAKGLTGAGLETEVLLYQRSEAYGKTPLNTRGRGLIDGVSYLYVGETPLQANNGLSRRCENWMDRRRAKSYLYRHLQQGDVVLGFIGTDVDYINDVIDVVHSRRAKYVRELNEIPYFGNQTRDAVQGYKTAVKKQFPKCDGFIAISDALVEFAGSHKSENAKIIKVPIIVDPTMFDEKDISAEPSSPYIFHAGTLYEQKDGILGMLEAFGMALPQFDRPVKYILSGTIDSSPHATEILTLFDRFNLKNEVAFVGYLYKDQIVKYLRRASLVISNRYRSKQNYYGFSTKVGEYLASGTPLITTDWGEAPKWLKDGESAYIVEAENIEALSKAIVRAFTNDEERIRIGKGGQKVCRENFDYRLHGRRLADFFKSI